MFRKYYKSMNEQIKPDASLISGTRSALNSCIMQQEQHRSTKLYKRPAVIAAVVFLCVIIALPVVAARVPAFNMLLSMVSPGISQFLQPIELSSEYDGIKMEVIAAVNDNDTAVAYLTFQDLTGNRIDKTIDLYDYYISGAYAFTSEVISYDEETRTATIRMLGNGGSNLDGKKVTLRVDSFLSGKHFYTDVKTGLDMASLLKSHIAKTVPYDTGKSFNSRVNTNTQILKTDQLNLPLPGIDFVNISNIGFVDGKLHIQTRWAPSIDNHGYLFLSDASGKKLTPDNISFRADEDGNVKSGMEFIKYEEYVFDIDRTDLEKYSVLGYFVKCDNFIKGKWYNTFRLDAVEKVRTASCSIDIGQMHISKVSVSPIGMTLEGKGNTESYKAEISAQMLDGSTQAFSSTVINHQNETIKIKYISEMPFDINNLKSININGNTIKLE